MTQREQILRFLREAGTRGVVSNEFYAAYMPRFAARIEELNEEGFVIAGEHEPSGGYRYRLFWDNEHDRFVNPIQKLKELADREEERRLNQGKDDLGRLGKLYILAQHKAGTPLPETDEGQLGLVSLDDYRKPPQSALTGLEAA